MLQYGLRAAQYGVVSAGGGVAGESGGGDRRPAVQVGRADGLVAVGAPGVDGYGEAGARLVDVAQGQLGVLAEHPDHQGPGVLVEQAGVEVGGVEELVEFLSVVDDAAAGSGPVAGGPAAADHEGARGDPAGDLVAEEAAEAVAEDDQRPLPDGGHQFGRDGLDGLVEGVRHGLAPAVLPARQLYAVHLGGAFQRGLPGAELLAAGPGRGQAQQHGQGRVRGDRRVRRPGGDPGAHGLRPFGGGRVGRGRTLFGGEPVDLGGDVGDGRPGQQRAQADA